MANKTAGEILLDYRSKVAGRAMEHWEKWPRKAMTTEELIDLDAEASRQLFEAEKQRIGSFESIELADSQFVKRDIMARNELRAEQLAKARAFYGITESGEEGKE